MSLFVTLLGACAQMSAKTSPTKAAEPEHAQEVYQPPATTRAPDPDGVVMLLRFAQNYAAMTPEAQKREYAQVSARRKTEFSRMQLVMMALLGRQRDDAKAQALLEEHLKAADSRDDGLRYLAVALKGLLANQPKPDDTVAQLTQKLKDEQKRADMLQHKLDELLAVEKTMDDRRESPTK